MEYPTLLRILTFKILMSDPSPDNAFNQVILKVLRT